MPNARMPAGAPGPTIAMNINTSMSSGNVRIIVMMNFPTRAILMPTMFSAAKMDILFYNLYFSIHDSSNGLSFQCLSLISSLELM